MVKHEKRGGEDEDGMVTALYKVNLHCQQCAREVQRPLTRTQGVQRVEVDIESGEVMVKGRVDPKEIHKRIEKISKRKVELVTPLPKSKEKKEIKELHLSTTQVKVHMHCGKCEYDLKRKILKLKGVCSVKTDMEAQTLTVDGTIDPPKLVEYIHKKVHKHAEIVTLKREKEEGQKERVKEVDFKLVELEEKKVEVKIKETSVPYIVHYVYAPQLFSDENPNACSIM